MAEYVFEVKLVAISFTRASFERQGGPFILGHAVVLL